MSKYEIKITNWPSIVKYNHTYVCQLRMINILDKHVKFELSSDTDTTLNAAISESALAFTPSKEAPQDSYITVNALILGKIVATKTIKFKIHKPNRKPAIIGFALGLGIPVIAAGTAVGLYYAFPKNASNETIVKSIVDLKDKSQETVNVIGKGGKTTVDFTCTFLDKDNKEIADDIKWTFNAVMQNGLKNNGVEFSIQDGILTIDPSAYTAEISTSYVVTVYGNTKDNKLKGDSLGSKAIIVNVEPAAELDGSIVTASKSSINLSGGQTGAVDTSDLSCAFYDTKQKPILGIDVKWVISPSLPIQEDGIVITFDNTTSQLKVDATQSTATEQKTYAITFTGQNQEENVPNPGNVTVDITITREASKPTSSTITTAPSSLEVTAGSSSTTIGAFDGSFLDQYGQPITTTPKWTVSAVQAPTNVNVTIGETSGIVTIEAANNHDVAQAEFDIIVTLNNTESPITDPTKLGTSTVHVIVKPDVVETTSSVNGTGQTTVSAGVNGEMGKKTIIFTPEFKNAGDKTIPDVTAKWIISGIPDQTEQDDTKITFTTSEENNQLSVTVDAQNSHIIEQKQYTIAIKANTLTETLSDGDMTAATFTVNVEPDTAVKSSIVSIDRSSVNINAGENGTSGSVVSGVTASAKYYNGGYIPGTTPEEEKSEYEIEVPVNQRKFTWEYETSSPEFGGTFTLNANSGSCEWDAQRDEATSSYQVKYKIKAGLMNGTTVACQPAAVTLNVTPHINSTKVTGDNTLTVDAQSTAESTNAYIPVVKNDFNLDITDVTTTWRIAKPANWPTDLQASINNSNKLYVDATNYNPASTETYVITVYADVTGKTLTSQTGQDVTITIVKPAIVIDSSVVNGGDDTITVDAQATKTATNAYTAKFYDATPTEIPDIEPSYLISAPDKPDTVNLSLDTDNKLVVDASNYVTESQATFTVSITANPKNQPPLLPAKMTAKTTTVTVNAYTPSYLPNKSVTVGPSSMNVTIGANSTSTVYVCNFYIDDTLYTDSVPTIWNVDPVGDLPSGVNVKMINNKLCVEAKQYSGEATSFDVNVYGSTTPAAPSFTYDKQLVTVNLVAKSELMESSTITGPQTLMAQIRTENIIEDPYLYEFKDENSIVVPGIPAWSYTEVSNYELPTGVTVKVNDDNQLVVDASNLTEIPTKVSKINLKCADTTVTTGNWNALTITIQFIPNTTSNLVTYDGTVYKLAENIDPSILCAGPTETLTLQTATGTINIAPENKSKITAVSIPSVDPNTTTIPPYFMYGFGITSIDLSGVPATATVQHNFLQECTNLTSINMGNITRANMLDVVESTNYNSTFFTVNDATAKAYTTGLTIRGIDKDNIVADFPSRLSGEVEAPYRKIQEYKNYLVQSDGTVIGLWDELDSQAFSAGAGFCTSTTNFTLKKYGATSAGNISKTGIREVVITSVASSVTTTTLPSQFLMNCKDLISVDLSGLKNFTTINGSFMNGCTSLTSVDLTGLGSITSTGSAFFSGCTGLSYVDFSPMTSLKSIGSNFFKDCSNIKWVDLSNCMSLTDVATGFFEQCSSLTTLYLPNKTPIATIVANGWGVVNSLQYVCCGSEATAALYAADDNWKGVNTTSKSKFTVQFIA